MKHVRVLLLAIAFVMLFSFAFAEEEGPKETVIGGYTVRAEEDHCIILDVTEEEITDGVLTVPAELDGKRVIGFEPAMIKEGVRLIVMGRSMDVYCDEDNAPDRTVRANVLRYAGFKELTSDELDRLPDIGKGEYALVDYSQVAISRNGSVSYSNDNRNFIAESELPAELFGKKAYNLIPGWLVARTEGDWTYTADDQIAMVRSYAGAGDKTIVIPETLGEKPVQQVSLSAIPQEAGYVYMPYGCWVETQNGEGSRTVLMVQYAGYERVKQDYEYLLNNTPEFTEDDYMAINLEQYTFEGENASSRQPKERIPASELLTEINGKGQRQ